MTSSEISTPDIDREMMDNSEMYVQGRFPQIVLQDVGKDSRAFYDAAQLRAAFRAGYDYARRTQPVQEMHELVITDDMIKRFMVAASFAGGDTTDSIRAGIAAMFSWESQT